MSYLENFHYQILGNEAGPKLIFLHGLMGSGANWRKVTPAFDSNYRILLLDQRGHGRSFHPDFGFTPEDYARDLESILDDLQWTEEIYLVGHSMGGRNALSFSNRSPHRIKKLVIVDIGPDSRPEAVTRIEFYLKSVPVPFADKKAAKRFFDEKFPTLLGGGKKAQVLAQYFYTNIEVKSDGSADWRFSPKAILGSAREGRADERWDQVRNLQVPTLLIRGGDSDELSSETYHRMLDANSLIQGVEIEHAGHWVHFDQVQKFTQAIEDFFNQY